VYGPFLFFKQLEAVSMETKPTYEELEQRVKEFEKELFEFKRIEIKLWESEAELFAIYNNAPITMILFDEDRRVLKANQIALEFTDRQYDEIEGLRCGEALRCIHATDPASCGFGVNCEECVVRNTVLDSLRTGNAHHNIEAPIQHGLGDGVVDLYFLLSTSPLNIAGKKTVLVCLENITEQKQAEEALRESEEKYRQLFATVSDAIIVFDAETREFITANDAASGFYGYSKEEFLELKYTDITAEPEKSDESIKQTVSGKISRIPIRYHKRKDGTTFPVEISSGTFKLGNRQMVCGVIRDITERKQSEEQIKASLKEKEILLQEIHHRVKNNMQIIISLLELQTSSSKDKKVEDALKESQGRVQAMSLVHETLYDTASMDSMDFRSYISRLSKTVFQSYGIRREQVELKIKAENISFRIDQFSHIGLIINELVSNSLKYAFPENRKGEIVIRLLPVDNGEVELIVSDNGLGIPEDLDWRNTGTLGLQIVTMLAEDQLDGTLNLDRVNGTHFNIRFKLKES
jgi:PAS domain S-box-containing protein